MAVSIVTRFFSNPHHYSAVIVARLAVLSATTFWGCIVLIKGPSALDPTRFPIYSLLVEVASPRVWAIGTILVPVASLVRMWRHARPHWSGAILYACCMLFWTYLAVGIFISPFPLPPAAAASISVVALLSIYAFVSNPKRHDPSDPV